MTAMKLLLMLLSCVLQWPNSTHAGAVYPSQHEPRENGLLLDVKPNIDLDSYTGMEVELLPMLKHSDFPDEEPPVFEFPAGPSEKPSMFKTMIKMLVHSNYPLAQIQHHSEPVVQQPAINYPLITKGHFPSLFEQFEISPTAMPMSQKQKMSYSGRLSQKPRFSYSGRLSQRPNLSYSGRTSQGPGLSYSGRMSQRPGLSYSGRMSQGPGLSYSGRMSQSPRLSYSGRMSQSPGLFYSGRMSPGDRMSYSGRMSQSPGLSYSGRMSPGDRMSYSGRMSQMPGLSYSGRMSPGDRMSYSGRMSQKDKISYSGRMAETQKTAHSGRMNNGGEMSYSGRLSEIPSPIYMDVNNLMEEQDGFLNYQPQVFPPWISETPQTGSNYRDAANSPLYSPPQFQPYSPNWNPLPVPTSHGWNSFSTPDVWNPFSTPYVWNPLPLPKPHVWNPFPTPDVWNPLPTPDVWNPFKTPDVWNPFKTPDFSIHSNDSNGIYEGSITGTGEITGSVDESNGLIVVEGTLVGGGQISGSIGRPAVRNRSSTEPISGSIKESNDTINSGAGHDGADGISIPVGPSTDNVNLTESNDTDLMEPFRIDEPADIGWKPFPTPNFEGPKIWNYEPADMEKMFGENFWNHNSYRQVN